MNKGIYTKENVGNGVFIFTANKSFVEPKFGGLHEENEQAQMCIRDRRIKCIKNDNNCCLIHARKFVDKDNPRVEIVIKTLD